MAPSASHINMVTRFVYARAHAPHGATKTTSSVLPIRKQPANFLHQQTTTRIPLVMKRATTTLYSHLSSTRISTLRVPEAEASVPVNSARLTNKRQLKPGLTRRGKEVNQEEEEEEEQEEKLFEKEYWPRKPGSCKHCKHVAKALLGLINLDRLVMLAACCCCCCRCFPGCCCWS